MICYIRWLLRVIISNYGKNPIVEFTPPIQYEKGWICLMKDKVNKQTYVCKFDLVEKEKTLEHSGVPSTVNELLKINGGV